MAKTKVAGDDQDLREQLLYVKERASNLSGDVTRLSKELGEARHQLEALDEVRDENRALAEEVEDLQKQVTAQAAALKTAAKQIAADAEVIEAAKAVADGLTKLASA